MASRRLLAQASTLLAATPASNALARFGPQLASYYLAMGEPALAQHVLRPLLAGKARRLGPAGRHQTTALLAQAYAGTGRYDSAYAQRAQTLADTLRAAQQFAAVAATEARFRTREQAAQTRLLTERDRQQAVQVRLAAAGAARWALTAAPLPTAVGGPVALAYRSAQRLLELVNRILNLTKLEAGRLELRPVPTAVASLLRRVVAQFDSLAAERRVALVAPTALPESLRLLLDADQVEQILTNLLVNALNHTPADGAVVVSAALPAPDGQYELTGRDTGPGIAAGEQAWVFERFYQSPQQQAQGGSGLVLALSHDLRNAGTLASAGTLLFGGTAD